MVLPVRRRAAEPVVVIEAHVARARVNPTGGGAGPPGPDQIHVLVVPDRHARTNPEDEVASDSRLAFGERIWTWVVRVPRAAASTPLRRPVGVQVDAAAVLSRSLNESIRI